MDKKPLNQMSQDEIKEAVKEKYGSVAKDPCVAFNFPVGKAFALKVGYPKEILDTFPRSMYESFTGANNPQPFVGLNGGETVLDLGCGVGIDFYFYAKAVGQEGKVYGVDISEEMVNKARNNMKFTGLTNVIVECGHSDNLLFADNFFDVIASNGIHNLSPDKEKVMHEVYRVLKPGGRTVFCEIILKEELSENIRKKDINDWFRCIGGLCPKKIF